MCIQTRRSGVPTNEVPKHCVRSGISNCSSPYVIQPYQPVVILLVLYALILTDLQFLTLLHQADAETIAEATKARSIRNRIFSVGDEERRAGAAAESAAGDHPLSGADGIVNASTEPALLASAIQMFQTYFSYELHHVMPLVVHQQSSIGMDFRNVQTWVKVSDDKLQACVAWRWREGASQECATQRVLEVLFLAAHSKIRRQQIGTSLVNSLIECAAANEAIMYVEVGINDWRSQVLALTLCLTLGCLVLLAYKSAYFPHSVKQVRQAVEQFHLSPVYIFDCATQSASVSS